MSSVLEKLRGGDLRSIGKSEEVVSDILERPELFRQVFDGMFYDDPIIRARSADAIEKVSRSHPEYLGPHKNRLINEASRIEQQEVRWHVAQMFSYLPLNKDEMDQIIRILLSWIKGDDKSKIVKVNSMQTLSDFAEKDKNLRLTVISKLEDLIKSASPAIVSRGKKLIARLKAQKGTQRRTGENSQKE